MSPSTTPAPDAAHPAAHPAPPEPPAHCLMFSLGEEVFATDIRSVREIIQCGAMTTVPLMPDFVRGVINLRGSVVPVIDLRSRFGRSAAVIGDKTCIVIVESVRDGERVELGMMVDAVSEVVELQALQIEPPPDFGTALRRDFMRGVVRIGNRFVILLDPGRAFDVEEMAALCEHRRPALAA